VHLPWEARRGLTVVQVKGLLAQKLRAGAYDDIYEGLR
jgi:hypothetical protein